jgi:hypothetical protein
LALTFEDELAWSAALKRIAFRHAARGPFVRQAHESDATDLRIMTYAQAHPRIAASNVPSVYGELVELGGRRAKS